MGRLIGIDEAGRGPVLGPLVMAAVAITLEQETALAAFGIRDSKKYGSGKTAKAARLAAVPAVRARCQYSVVVFPTDIIDAFVDQGGLFDAVVENGGYVASPPDDEHGMKTVPDLGVDHGEQHG